MRFARREKPEVEVNLTPLIDVVFLLLIFFMVTTTFNQHANLRVELPDASNAVQSNEENKVEVIIDKNGQYFIDGTSLLDQQSRTLVTALGKVVKDRNTEKILIRADAQAPHQSVVSVMDAAGKLGLTQISIATSSGQDSSN